MSTMAMRHLIQLVRTGHEPTAISIDAAEREVEAIEAAAKHYVSFEDMTGAPDDLMESIARDAP